MEEDPESKHVCKFCRKSFSNGRSLGGHVRSHVCSTSAETEQKLNNGGNDTKGGEETGYDLRENPKKTWRFAVSKVQSSEKFCKECGRGFHSWKALFGHMKRHSGKEKFSNSLQNDQDSSSNASQKLALDSQSDHESAAAPSQRRRSGRRTTRYTPAASNSSLSFVNNPSSSVSEIEQEQEEVAMSLMMLSRDSGPWGGLNFAAASSDNNSACFEAKSSVLTNSVSKIKGKKPISSGCELAKLKKLGGKKLEIGNSNSAIHNSKRKKSCQIFATGSAKNGLMNEEAKKSEVGCNQSAMEDSDEKRKKEVDANKKLTSIKRKFLDTESLKNLTKSTEKAELSKNIDKRGKFECTSCSKIFNSYQALGGHKASHKKIKGISSDNSIETNPTTDTSKFINNNSENEDEVDVAGSHNDEAENVSESKKSRGHECPICLKVFSSGQALGGHKRSHLAESSRNFQTSVAIQKPVEEIRDLLDLNLPAADRKMESNSHADESGSYRTWWVGNNHNHEALVGL